MPDQVDLSQFNSDQLIDLQRSIRKELERRRQVKKGRIMTFDVKKAEVDQLEREAYPRKHWTSVEEAFEGSDNRLIGGIGEWKYDPETLTIMHEDYPYYGISLVDMTTAAKLLDHLLQITTKGFWAYDSLGDLIGLIELICLEEFQQSLQSVFCPSGESRTVQWRRTD